MAKDGVLIHDSADKVPASPASPPHAIISYTPAEKPRARGMLLPAQAWMVITLVAVLPVLAGLVAFWGFVAAHPWLGEALGYLVAACVVLGLVGVLWGALDTLRARRARLEAEAAQAAIARSRLGNPFDARQVGRLDLLQLESLAAQFELARAPYTIHPMLSTQSLSNTASPAPVLTEPELQLVRDAEWRTWLAEAPHVLISGPTGAGKTTLATVLLGDASERGAALLILDPHDAAGKWPLEAIGGGRDYTAIYAALGGLMHEMNTRFEALRQGETQFGETLVLLDEAPAVALHDPKVWQGLVSRLTSEARKIGLRFVLLGQSHLVRDLGLSSLVRRNLGLVALGPQALDLVADERDPVRRRQLLDLVRRQQRPAAFSCRAQVHVLDVAAVPRLAERGFTAHAWRPSVPMGLPTLHGVSNEHRGPSQSGDGGRVDADVMRETLVVSLKRQGRTREEIRQVLNEMGLGLRNGEYSAILSRHGL